MTDETNKTLDNVLGSRARARINSTATVITGDIVSEDSSEAKKQEETSEKEHGSEAQD